MPRTSGKLSLSRSVRREPMKQAAAFVKEILFAFLAVLLINSFVMASFEVPTPSMEKTIMVGDRLLVNKLIYGGTTPYTIPFTSVRIPHLRVPGFRSVRRGDAIVFDWPGERDRMDKPEQMFYLKRCIGLPGDTIQIAQRTVYVNGKPRPLPEHAQFLRQTPFPAAWADPAIFPAGSVYNQDNWGPAIVPRHGEEIALKPSNVEQWAVFIAREGHRLRMSGDTVLLDGVPATQYTVARDYVFAMGDNRDNSFDSRYWGFVPVEDIIGTPMIVFWSWNPQIPLYDLPEKLSSINLRRIGTIIR